MKHAEIDNLKRFVYTRNSCFEAVGFLSLSIHCLRQGKKVGVWFFYARFVTDAGQINSPTRLTAPAGRVSARPKQLWEIKNGLSTTPNRKRRRHPRQRERDGREPRSPERERRHVHPPGPEPSHLPCHGPPSVFITISWPAHHRTTTARPFPPPIWIAHRHPLFFPPPNDPNNKKKPPRFCLCETPSRNVPRINNATLPPLLCSACQL